MTREEFLAALTAAMTDEIRTVNDRYRAMPREHVHAEVHRHMIRALGREFPTWLVAYHGERARRATIPILGLPLRAVDSLKGGE